MIKKEVLFVITTCLTCSYILFGCTLPSLPPDLTTSTSTKEVLIEPTKAALLPETSPILPTSTPRVDLSSTPSLPTTILTSSTELLIPIIKTKIRSNVRECPGMEYKILEVLAINKVKEIIGKDGKIANWWQIRLSSNQSGWIANSIVQVEGDTNDIPIAECTAEHIVRAEIKNVFNCQHKAGFIFVWYKAEVYYDQNGMETGNTILDGPFEGEWTEGCPPSTQIPPTIPLPTSTRCLDTDCDVNSYFADFVLMRLLAATFGWISLSVIFILSFMDNYKKY